WTFVPGTLDTDNNSLTTTGQTQLTRFTLSDDCLETTTITEANCQDVSITLDDDGTATVSVADIDAGSTGACGLAAIYLNVTTLDCDDIGDNTVILTVIGNDGGRATCTSTVTVADMDDRLAPVLEGVTFNPSTGLYEACFGYDNDNACPVNVAVGAGNRFTPGTDLGQPSAFLPGRQVSVFCVDLAPGETIVWTLTGPDGNTRTATASAPQTTLVAYVWDDQNGNGKQDGGEPGIAGATVELVRNSDGAVLQTAISQADGSTNFADLEAFDGTQVKLKFYEKTDHRFSLKDQGNNDNIDSDANRTNGFTSVFTLNTNAVTTRWDCGLWSPGTAEAYVWDDQNGNGKQDGSEPAISGVEITLLESDGVTALAIASTDANGVATFTDVPADRPVLLQFSELADYRLTLKDQGSNDNIDSDANRTNGKTGTFQADRGAQVHTQMDAGLWSPGNVEAYVWDDQNGNGKQDDGEPALANVKVSLLESDDTFVATVFTNDQGIAEFSNIPADRPMKLQFYELPDYRFTLKDQGSNDNIDSDANRTNGKTGTFQANRGAQVHTQMDAGLWSPGSVEAYVWDDQNGNGKQDMNEPAITGVEVKLLEADGATELGSTTTDATGVAMFTEVPADRPVMLQFFELEDYRFTLKDQGSNDNIDSDASRNNGKTGTFQADKGAQVHTQMDAGLWSPASVEAYVWDDLNGNGKQDAGEPGLEGVSVSLLEANGDVLESTTSGMGGLAILTNVPADRSVKLQFGDLADYELTLRDQGSNNNIDSDPSRSNGITATFAANQGSQTFTSWDAGYITTVNNLVGGTTQADQITADDAVIESDVAAPQVEFGQPEATSLDFRVYPNPTRGQVQIDLSGMTVKNGNLIIRDAKGQVIYQQIVDLWEQTRFEVNLKAQHLPAGSYFIQYQTEEDLYTKKLILTD
ncbi:MAG: SdrD B-like domain-containing protein, partial [Bacteroidota bacterium]